MHLHVRSVCVGHERMGQEEWSEGSLLHHNQWQCGGPLTGNGGVPWSSGGDCSHLYVKAPTVGPEAGVEGVSVPVEAAGEMSDNSQPQTVSV